jgi:hypothetical protein
MNTPLFHLKKRRLSPDYFNFKSPWFFNTPDMFPFAYLLLGLLISLCLLCLLLLVILGVFSASPSTPETVTQAISETPATPETPIVEEDNNVSPLIKNAQKNEDVDTQINNAKSQPTYDLRLQALIKVEEAPTLNAEQKQEITQLKAEYTEALTAAQKVFLSVENALEKEYYSTAVSQSKALIDQGEVLGVLYTNAQDAFEKSHLRKIDYYLKVAQLNKAEEALKEAQQANLNPEKLQDYEKKIQALKNL